MWHFWNSWLEPAELVECVTQGRVAAGRLVRDVSQAGTAAIEGSLFELG